MVSPAKHDVQGFIRKGDLWNIHPSRERTRRACIEILGRVPRPVQDLIITSKRILLIAPGGLSVGLVYPYTFISNVTDTLPRRFQVIVLDKQLEDYPEHHVLGFTVKCIAAALRPVLNGHTLDVTPEDIAISWGFRSELEFNRSALKGVAVTQKEDGKHRCQ
jgi:hypothetical protein